MQGLRIKPMTAWSEVQHPKEVPKEVQHPADSIVEMCLSRHRDTQKQTTVQTETDKKNLFSLQIYLGGLSISVEKRDFFVCF